MFAGSSSGTVEDEAAVYVIGIIENLGSDMARQCYWNVGRWSDLWKVWRMAGDERPLIDGIDFQVGVPMNNVWKLLL